MKELSAQKIGKLGEKIAVGFLKKSGFHIIARNKRYGKNELDIIANDEQYIVFVEVKTRSFSNEDLETIDRPSDAVNRSKRLHTIEAARDHLKTHPCDLCPRFDVIEVYLDRACRYKPFKLNHIPDAFGVRGTLRR